MIFIILNIKVETEKAFAFEKRFQTMHVAARCVHVDITEIWRRYFSVKNSSFGLNESRWIKTRWITNRPIIMGAFIYKSPVFPSPFASFSFSFESEPEEPSNSKDLERETLTLVWPSFRSRFDLFLLVFILWLCLKWCFFLV